MIYITNGIANALHILAAVIWIGGMFFAYMALRPAAASTLAKEDRLKLWNNTFAKFFPWVFVCVICLLASGAWLMVFYKGGWDSGMHVHMMIALGIIMILIFLHVYFAPYKRLRSAVVTEEWDKANESLSQIRMLIGVNLMVGLVLSTIATVGTLI